MAHKVRRVALVGASSQIGRALLPRLAAAGVSSYRIGREPAPDGADPVYVFDEQRACFTPALDGADAVISLAPLPTVATVLKMAKVLGAKRAIAFGSTGRFSKRGSSSALERDFVLQQEHAEQVFSSQSEAADIAWTLFRPTMIYGADADQNVSFIKTMVTRFGFFPVPWGARGLRQPVHVDDLAAACVSVLECERSFGCAYNLGGGEVMAFPDLVRQVFQAVGKRPVLLPVPRALYFLIIAVVRKLPVAAFVRDEMVTRMYQDLTADNRSANEAFGFDPRKFLSQ